MTNDHASVLRPPEIRYRLQRLIGGLDRLAVQLEGALRFDQRHKLFDRIDVAGFEEPAQDRSRAVLPRLADDRWAGRVCGRVDAAAQQLQTLRIGELRELQLPDDRLGI